MKKKTKKQTPKGILIGLTSLSLALLPLAGCQLGGPGSGPLGMGWFGSQQQSQPQRNQARPYTGQIDLQFDPSLLGQQYQGLPKVPFSGSFRVQNQGGGPPVRNTGVKPRLDCVAHHSNGTYTAYFGYEHSGTEPVTIPIGPTNQLVGPNNDPKYTDPRDRGQPTSFQPGQTPAYPDSAIAVDFSNGTLTWILDGQQVKANKHSLPKCSGTPGPSPTPSATPSPDPSASPTPVPSPTPEPTPTPQEVVFDPADPSSLGDLYPSVPGNNPEAVVPETFEAAFSLNGEPPSPLQNGVLAISVSNPGNLNTILSRYNAQLLDDEPSNDGVYWIRADMTTIDLTQLETNLRTLNSNNPDPQSEFVLTQASFGNLESAKTFALLVELLADGLVDSIAFNGIHSTNTVETREGAYFSGSSIISLDAQNSWWLNDNSTRITRAWDYSMGYNVQENRPVSIAVMDAGFAGLYKNSMGQGGFEQDIMFDRIDWNNGFLVIGNNPWADTKIWNWFESNPTLQAQVPQANTFAEAEDYRCLLAPHCDNSRPDGHGTAVLSVIISETNNAKGIAGIAPQAKIIPIKIGDGKIITDFTHETGLKELLRRMSTGLKVDILNQSFGSAISNYSIDFSRYYSENQSTYLTRANLISSLTNLGVTVVGGAGNGSWNAERNYIAGPSMFNNVITVGGISDANPNTANPPNDLRRYVDISSAPGLVADHGSNYGGSVHIWAPGQDVFALNAKMKNQPFHTELDTMEFARVTGTSISAPIVSGVIALLKAKNSTLSTAQILTLLKKSAIKKTNVRDDFARTYPFLDPNLILPAHCTSMPSAPDCGCGSRPAIIGGVWNYQNIHCGNHQTVFYDMDIMNAEAAMQEAAFPKASIISGILTQVANEVRLQQSGNTYILSWGENPNGSYITSLMGKNRYTNQFVRIGSMLNAPVEVKGIIKNNTIYFHSVERVSSIPPSSAKQWKVKLYNINDRVEMRINGNLVHTLVTNTGLGFSNVDNFQDGVDITQHLNDTGNQINFRVFNNDQNVPQFFLPFAYAGTGWQSIDNSSSWAIELLADDQIVYRDIRGNAAANRPDNSYFPQSNLPRFGARRNSPNTGQALNDTILVNKDGSVPVSSGPFQLRMYNVSDTSSVVVNNNQTYTLTAQSPFDTVYNIDANIVSGNNTLDFKVNTAANQVGSTWPNAVASFIQSEPGFPSHNLTNINNHLQHQRGTYTWGFDLFRNGQLIYRNRDGERENLEVGSGTYQSFPSGGRFNQKSPSQVQVLNERLNFFRP